MVAPPSHSLTADHARSIAQRLRGWANKILAGLEEDQLAEETIAMEDAVTRLASFADAWGRQAHTEGSDRNITRETRIVTTFAAAARLRNRGQLADIFRNTFHAAFPTYDIV